MDRNLMYNFFSLALAGVGERLKMASRTALVPSGSRSLAGSRQGGPK